MSILEWLHLISESVTNQAITQQAQAISQASIKSTQILGQSSASLNLTAALNKTVVFFVAYTIVSLMIRKAAYLVAFFMSCILFEASFFDPLSEAELYLLTFAIYSYTVFVMPCNRFVIFACVTMLLLSITLAYDAYFYGVGGAYGESKTFVYNNIEILALYAHSFLIAALVPYRRISNFIGLMSDAFVRFSVNSVNFAIL